ncbi:hypothetical protein SDC9_91587 [bioreactor metagenome]|uniref:Uncharacterized protein n=1 Tax=bioreactor metagenome TaxID=1076179 RepID=A0A644ZVF4_9ZZZZ|nr:hypothetical protein [Sphaerochaeta sp.]
MRELFKYPVVQAARTAASYQLLSQEALHAMGIAHVQRTLEQQQFEILFHSEALLRYPHLKAYREGEDLWWVIVESSMYPQTPSLGSDVARQLLIHAKSEEAKVFYAPVMFINTKNQNLGLPSRNGQFTALFNGFVPITRK